ncbi:MAG: glycoside hydrolase family 88 protein [Saprospiraceae bacterium]|nr:glycoside hydrolase family 88 protein [Saprospiraceae bacterium]
MKMNSNVNWLVFGLFVWSLCCQCQSRTESAVLKSRAVDVHDISNDKAWSERMALSVMKRHPEAWMVDAETPQWNYTQGIMMKALWMTGLQLENPVYLDYARSYADTMIRQDGSIRDYQLSDFNIDHVCPGIFLLPLYRETGEPKYLSGIQNLKKQLEWQPKTRDGGYWHKLRYPWQMWLDGLYMGEPFLAEYARDFQTPELYEEVVFQFSLAESHLRDSLTGLLYHGWDESHIQSWADPQTGCSPHFWGRAIGWYAMALVDVLDYLPADHSGRKQLISILQRTMDAVLKVRDKESRLWWQILDKPAMPGNYLEATASCMFVYTMIKGAQKGYLDASYNQYARESYQAILTEFIEIENDGEVHLTRCCSVAGLGGNPYRDGSYEYYVNEPVRQDDPKGVGPFIFASLEFEKANIRFN